MSKKINKQTLKFSEKNRFQKQIVKFLNFSSTSEKNVTFLNSLNGTYFAKWYYDYNKIASL